MMPRVSVCIPTYNTARYLPKSIESVLAQEFADFELVICDNASSDDTPGICRGYDDPRIHYVRFDEFVGQSANWNRCLELARGEYVVLLHADDALQPAFLKRAVSMLEHNPPVGFVHCSVQHINESGAPLHLQKLWDEDRIDAGEVLFKRLLLEGCVVNPAGVLVRSSAYKSAGEFAEEIVWGVDWHMWMRIALNSRVGYLTEPLAFYRQHQQSGTSGVMTTARNAKDEMWMIDDILNRIPDSGTELRGLYRSANEQSAHRTWCFAEELCRLGFMSSARAQIKGAINIQPRLLLSARLWALWAATYLGYGWFDRLHAYKNRLVSRQASATWNSRQL